jgi:hypothetical protein
VLALDQLLRVGQVGGGAERIVEEAGELASKPWATPAEMARSPSPPTMIGAELVAAPAVPAVKPPEATSAPATVAAVSR